MTAFETIRYEIDASVATLTINRPEKYNAITLGMLRELRIAIDLASDNDDVSVVVLRAAGGKVFSAGIDLSSGLFEDAENLTANMQGSVLPLLEALLQNDKPVIASVRGMAVGLAASIALACDLMIMADDAELRLVFAKLGIVPDGGACYQLVNKLGYSKALQIALEAQTLDAGRCLALGIANKVVPAKQLDSDTASWAATLAQNSEVSQPLTKSLMRTAANGAGLSEVANLEAVAQGRCVASDYCVQAYTTFLNSRSAPAEKKR